MSVGCSRQGYQSGLPCPPPGDLSNPGIEPESLVSPALAGRFFTTSATWEAPPIEHMPELPGAELLGEWSCRRTAVAAVELLQSCPTLCDRMDHIACQAPLSMGFPRQKYWSGLPFPTPGDLRDPGIEPTSLVSPALAGRFFTTSTTWEVWTLGVETLKCNDF